MPTKEKPTDLLIDSPVGMLSPPDEIRAWLRRLDELEAEVAPNSGATEAIASERKEANSFLKFSLANIPPDKYVTAADSKTRRELRGAALRSGSASRRQ